MKNKILMVAAVVILAGVGIGAKYLPVQEENLKTFSGTIQTGAELGEAKSFCGGGFYLVADPDTYLVNQTTMLLLRDESREMLSDRTLAGARVTVQGIYPAQDAFCEALACQCEDYILVKKIVKQ